MNLHRTKEPGSTQHGGAIIAVLVSSALAVLAMLGAIQVADGYFKGNAKIRSGARAASAHSVNLTVLADKFRINGLTPPTWYPEPYPTPAQMAAGVKPVIGVILADTSGLPAMVSTEVPNRDPLLPLPSLRFTLDRSRMASVLMPSNLRRDPQGNPVDFQKAFLAVADLNLLTAQQIGTFFRFPNTGWPTQSGGTTFQAIQKTDVAFLRFLPNPAMPSWASEVLISAETTLPGLPPISTVASLALDAPPDPACQIRLAAGQVQPLIDGTQASFVMTANSITDSGRLSGDNGTTYQTLSIVGNQSIRTLGTFNAVATPVSFLVPLYPPPGGAFNGGRRWRIRGSVTGVRNIAGPQSCQLDVTVAIPPPPICTLSANPPKPQQGQQTLLTLQCVNRVASAVINGQNVPFNVATGTASLLFTKPTNDSQTIVGAATGPGGVGPASVVLAAAVCRFADPNYVEISNIGYARELSGGPMRSYPASGGYYNYGGSGGTGWADQGDDISLACGSRTYLGPPVANYICLFAGYTAGPWPSPPEQFITHIELYPADSINCAVTRVRARPGGGGCLVAGTRIQTAQGRWRAIEDLQEGDWLLNPQTHQPVQIKALIAGPESEPLWRVRSGERSVRVTAGHPFLTGRGLLQAKALRPGDRLKAGRRWRVIDEVSREAAPQREWVWNLELSGENDLDHFISAEGLPSGDLVLQNRLGAP